MKYGTQLGDALLARVLELEQQPNAAGQALDAMMDRKNWPSFVIGQP